MKTLLIGKKEDMHLVYQALKNVKLIDKTVYWNDDCGPEEIEPDMLAVYDWIIAAVQNEKHAGYLYKLLKALIGDGSKIINFYAVYRAMIPSMKVERVMKNPLIPRYDGMIFGISHAYCGILPRCLDVVFCNLAVSSQDIYYNYKTLEHCFLHYRNKIADMKYPFVFLDLKEHEISKERACYYDVSHLNYYGAVKFTKLLNEYIKGEQV